MRTYLECVAGADQERSRSRCPERAVIEAPAAAQTIPGPVERESRHDHDVAWLQRLTAVPTRRFEDAEGPSPQIAPIAHGHELEIAAVDSRKERQLTECADPVEERLHRQLVAQRRVDRPSGGATTSEPTQERSRSRLRCSASIRLSDLGSHRIHLSTKRALGLDDVVRDLEPDPTHPLVSRCRPGCLDALDQLSQPRKRGPRPPRLDDLPSEIERGQHGDIQRVDGARAFLDPPHRHIDEVCDLLEELGALVAPDAELLSSNPHRERALLAHTLPSLLIWASR